MTKKNILFLTTEFPLPLDNGGKIRTYELVKSISKNHEVDLLCFSEKKIDEDLINDIKNICSSVHIINKVYTNSYSVKKLLKNIIKGIIKNKPFIVEKFYDKKYKKTIVNLVETKKYDIVFFDHLNITCYFDLLKKYDVKSILSQHNCEYQIIRRTYEKESNKLKQLFLYYEYKKTRKYEIDICKNFNKIIVLTEEDRKMLFNDEENKNVNIIPITVDAEYKKQNYSKTIKNLLFMGTMSWYPNEHAVIWFLENVWNELLNIYPELNLYIVGKSPSDKIKSYENERVIITGYVQDINEYIELSDVCIVPIFIGGGMRVKILEAMAKGIPVISTTIGAEGIEYEKGKNIIIADTSEELINSIKNLKENINMYENLVKNAQKLIENKYSIKQLESSLSDLIDKLYI